MLPVFQELSWKGNKHHSSRSTNSYFHRCVKDAISLGLWHPSASHLWQSTQEQPLQTGPSWGHIKVFPLHTSQVVVLTSAEIFLLTRHLSKEIGLGWHTPKYNIDYLEDFPPPACLLSDKGCVPTLGTYLEAWAGSAHNRSDEVHRNPTDMCHPAAHLGIQLPHCKGRTTAIGHEA